MDKIKTDRNKCWKSWNSSCTASVNVMWHSCFWKVKQFLKKLELPYVPGIPLLNVCTRKNEKIHPQNYSYTAVHSRISHNSQNMEAAHIFIKWRTNKQNVVYLYNEIWFSNKKKWSTDTFYNMNEPWKHHTKWKKSDKKMPHHILHDSIYMKCLRQENPHKHKVISRG